MNSKAFIQEHVLRSIVLDRTPGYHFCGNFMGMIFEDVYDGRARVTIPDGPHLKDKNGHLSPICLAIAADFAAASAIRTAEDPAQRLATVNLHVQLTNASLNGDLVARGELLGYSENAQGRLGLAKFEIHCNDQLVAFGTGTFMVLPAPGGRILHPVPWINRRPPESLELPDPTTLEAHEKEIYTRAQNALTAYTDNNTPFLDAFLNIRTQTLDGAARAEMDNGPHVGNRVGHLQGGISLALAMASANASLPENWNLSGITAAYVSPGQGDAITAYSDVVHQGRLTAVISTKLITSEGRLVLEVTTNHVRQQDKT